MIFWIRQPVKSTATAHTYTQTQTHTQAQTSTLKHKTPPLPLNITAEKSFLANPFMLKDCVRKRKHSQRGILKVFLKTLSKILQSAILRLKHKL